MQNRSTQQHPERPTFGACPHPFNIWLPPPVFKIPSGTPAFCYIFPLIPMHAHSIFLSHLNHQSHHSSHTPAHVQQFGPISPSATRPHALPLTLTRQMYLRILSANANLLLRVFQKQKICRGNKRDPADTWLCVHLPSPHTQLSFPHPHSRPNTIEMHCRITTTTFPCPTEKVSLVPPTTPGCHNATPPFVVIRVHGGLGFILCGSGSRALTLFLRETKKKTLL